MAEAPNALKVLLRQRHLQGLSAFTKEYNKVARTIDPELERTGPSKAQFYRWLSGEVRSLPYAHHCRVLEEMFPGWKVEQLFEPHSGDLEFVPEPPTNQTPAAAKAVAAQGMADVTAVFASRPEFTHELPPHKLFDDAEHISIVGLSLNMLCQQYPDRALLELLESGTVVEALFLDPDGEQIKAREREERHPDGVLTTLTRLNIQTLQRLADKLSAEARPNLRIRVYDEAVRYNITVINDATCVIQPYLPDARGVESPTFVAEKRAEGTGLFDTYAQVFRAMWDRGHDVTP